jgi:hypothetical protein
LGCLLEAVGLAVDRDDLGVMDEAIDQGGDAGRGGEDLAPFGERAIGRHQGALVLIAARDELEQQIGKRSAGIATWLSCNEAEVSTALIGISPSATSRRSL